MCSEEASGPVLMVLTGEPDESRASAWCARIRALRADGHTVIACDVNGISGCAATVLQALARIALTARQSGCRIVLVDADDRVRFLLELAGLREVWGSGGPEGG
ncbi:STAS domain-containing protein [Nocardia sp. NPDC004722]